MSHFFIDLVSRTDEARRSFETHPVVLDAVANGMSLDRYRALLSELYSLVLHFNPGCAVAASRMTDRFPAVRSFLYEHMHEESGHETWVLDDLEAIGVARDRVLSYAPSPHVLALNGYNYWAADRKHPCSILGMMYVLEVIASVYGGPVTSAIRDSLLLETDRGISFISSHATLDAAHMAELRVVMNQIEDDDAKDSIVAATAFNFHQFTRILEAI